MNRPWHAYPLHGIAAIINEHVAPIRAWHGDHLFSLLPALGFGLTRPCKNRRCAHISHTCGCAVLIAEDVARVQTNVGAHGSEGLDMS